MPRSVTAHEPRHAQDFVVGAQAQSLYDCRPKCEDALGCQCL